MCIYFGIFTYEPGDIYTICVYMVQYASERLAGKG